jgi:queuine tRNA-ribosyltransferase
MARSLQEHLKNPNQQAMYGVVHGGTDKELRKHSVEYLASLPFDGYAIGGSLGKDREEMVELLECVHPNPNPNALQRTVLTPNPCRYLLPHVPTDKPNHLLGIADEESIEACVPFGIDTFDSCNPTRIARHGNLLTSEGVVRIKSLKYVDDFGPIDPNLETVPYTRAYLHHLIKQNEPLFATLATTHNLYFMNNLMKDIRERIMKDEI